MAGWGLPLGMASDPRVLIPGSAAHWRDQAAQCRATEVQAWENAVRLRELVWSNGNRSISFDLIKAKTMELAAAQDTMSTAFSAAADALEDYADALHTAQAQASRAVELFRQSRLGINSSDEAAGKRSESVREAADEMLTAAKLALDSAEEKAILTLADARQHSYAASIWDGFAPVPLAYGNFTGSSTGASLPTVERGAAKTAFKRVRLAAVAAVANRREFETSLRALFEGFDDCRFDPAEVIAAIAALSSSSATQFNAALEAAKSFRRVQDVTSRLSSILLEAAADNGEVTMLTEKLSALEPSPPAGKANGWITMGQLGVKPFEPEDVNQGRLNDCWLLSALGAQVAADSTVLTKHLRRNPNGTYTVTLHKKGRATKVTVSTRFPQGARGKVVFAGGGYGGASPNWVSIFEKAAAQLIGEGKYARIENGIGSTGISVVSGPEASTYGPRFAPWQTHLSLAQIKTMVAERRPIVPMTAFTFRDSTITDRHAYYVVGITDDDKIMVRNPWGKRGAGGVLTTLRLTEEQFNTKFFTSGAGN